MRVKEINQAAKKIWDYHHLHHKVKKADCLLVLGGNDVRVAEYAAGLFFQGLTPLIIFSGGRGRLTRQWQITEAEKFAEIAAALGVPRDQILIENQSSNTGENLLFTEKLFKNAGLNPQKFIVVTKPYKERRTYAAFKKQWSEKEIIVTSPPISFEKYPNENVSPVELINSLVGELQRIQVYPGENFQIRQEIPTDIWQAYNDLVAAGYTRDLVEK